MMDQPPKQGSFRTKSKISIGIEGISMRHSVAVLSDADGRVLAGYRDKRYPLSLHTTTPEELGEGLLTILSELANLASIRVSEVQAANMCVGLTGVTFPFEAGRQLPHEMARIGIRPSSLHCTGDAELILPSHLYDSDGTVLVGHMGSAVLVKCHGHSWRIGGWGPLIGDEGSGYWLGRACLRLVAMNHDTRSQPSALWRAVDEWLSLPDEAVAPWRRARIAWRRIRDLQDRNHSDARHSIFSFANEISRFSIWEWRTIVSGLTFPLFTVVQDDDAEACQLIDDAAACLASQVLRALDLAVGVHAPMPLVLYGGLFRSPRLQSEVLRHIRRKYQPSRVILSGDSGTMRPVFGALLYALAGSQDVPRCPPREVYECLLEQQNLHNSGDLKND